MYASVMRLAREWPATHDATQYSLIISEKAVCRIFPSTVQYNKKNIFTLLHID